MHHFGDKDVDWNGIDDAAIYICDFCAFWGRFGGQAKEKFGTVRFYANFGCYSLISITHPRYHFKHSIWQPYVKFDNAFGESIVRFSGLRLLLNWWQPKVYRLAYKKALQKWPHLRDEILCCADYNELLEGL